MTLKHTKEQKYKLIYNPNAGAKRSLVPGSMVSTLEDIKLLVDQYQLSVDFAPTQAPGHATTLARHAIKEGYSTVIAAGGDGTVGEVANGLIGSRVLLGILPLGTFMNIAKMLSIPNSLELAVALIKIGRVRTIDAGSVTRLDGEKLSEPYYFLEGAGVGIEAELHEIFSRLEKGNAMALIECIKVLREYFKYKVKIIIDDKEIERRAGMVLVSNGPMVGANLKLAPNAKLNDHRLTISINKMSRWELCLYVLKLLRLGTAYSPKIERFEGQKVRIITQRPKPLHADARLFGTTPVEFKIIPGALHVITGFPTSDEHQPLLKRTYLDP